MPSSKLLLITGLPGTGKTTFAGALAEAIDARHLNSDKVRTDLDKRGQYDEQTKAAVYQEMLRQTEAALRDGDNVIVDATFYKRELREPYEELAKRRQVPIFWIELKAEEATVRERVAQKRAYSEADYEVYRKVKANYEPLPAEHLALWSDQLTVEEMVEEAKRYLAARQIND